MKFYLFFSLFLSPLFLFAQIDSTENDIDTIYIKESPVIIRSEYYLPRKSFFKASNLYASAGFGIGRINKTPDNTQFSNFLNPGIELGKKFNKHISVSLGISSLNFKEIINHNKKIEKEFEKKYTVTDTIDTYYQLIGGAKTAYYVTESRDTLVKYTESRDTTLKSSAKLSYILLPLTMHYTLQRHRFYFSVGIGIINGFLVSKPDFTNDAFKKSLPPKNIFAISGDIGLGVKISQKFNVEAYYQSVKSFPLYSSAKSSSDISYRSVGGRLIYFF